MTVSECVDNEPYIALVTTTAAGVDTQHFTELKLQSGSSNARGDPCKECSYTKRKSGANYDATCYWPCMDTCWCSLPSLQDSGEATYGECVKYSITWYADRRFAPKMCEIRIVEGVRREQLLWEHCTNTCSRRCLVSDVKNVLR